MTRTALITGVFGQDGTLLARHLLQAGWQVVGTHRKSTNQRLAPYLDGVTLVEHDLRDIEGFTALLDRWRPDAVYNLAGFTSVNRSWDARAIVTEVNATAVEAMLDVLLRHDSGVRFFQASSSEVFGHDAPGLQTVDLPHRPVNPYGEAKSQAHLATIAAREAGLFASVGILYNHESPIRGTRFVTGKITRAVAEIAAGQREKVQLGNLDVSRDWGAAREYVAAMHRCLDVDTPNDHIIATGQLRSLRDLVETAFDCAGISDAWSRVEHDASLVRRSDAPGSTGDPSGTLASLGWQAEASFEQIIAEMVAVDMKRVETGVEECPSYLDTVSTTR